MSETMHLWEKDHNGELVQYPVPSGTDPSLRFVGHYGPRCKLCGTNPCIGCEGSDKMMEDCPAWLRLFEVE